MFVQVLQFPPAVIVVVIVGLKGGYQWEREICRNDTGETNVHRSKTKMQNRAKQLSNSLIITS